MRSNSMKKCAVGAMLVGGTLGGVSTAQAGVTWLGSGAVGLGEYSSRNDVFVSAVHVVDDNVGSIALNSWSGGGATSAWTYDWYGSATAGSGFSVGFSTNGLFGSSVGLINVNGQRVFEVTGTETLTINLSNGWGGNVFATVYNNDGFLQDMTVGTNTVTLGPGTYLLEYGSEWYQAGAYSGDFVSVVPAPGAVALLGAAGLVGGRRRRA